MSLWSEKFCLVTKRQPATCSESTSGSATILTGGISRRTRSYSFSSSPRRLRISLDASSSAGLGGKCPAGIRSKVSLISLSIVSCHLHFPTRISESPRACLSNSNTSLWQPRRRSASTSSTFLPPIAQEIARLAAIVVLPSLEIELVITTECDFFPTNV